MPNNDVYIIGTNVNYEVIARITSSTPISKLKAILERIEHLELEGKELHAEFIKQGVRERFPDLPPGASVWIGNPFSEEAEEIFSFSCSEPTDTTAHRIMSLLKS